MPLVKPITTGKGTDGRLYRLSPASRKIPVLWLRPAGYQIHNHDAVLPGIKRRLAPPGHDNAPRRDQKPATIAVQIPEEAGEQPDAIAKAVRTPTVTPDETFSPNCWIGYSLVAVQQALELNRVL